MKIFCSLLLALLPLLARGEEFVWYSDTKPVTVAVATPADMVVSTALEMFDSDMAAVTGSRVGKVKPKAATIVLTQLNRASRRQRERLKEAGVPVEQLDTLTDGFNIRVADGQMLVTGANGRGTAYGLLELSRMAGVSPWIWWGDVRPERRARLAVDEDFSTTQGASVELRGVFLNDEDWSLRPWSYGTFEPDEFGTIGPRTYKEIFKLLMRLRANAVWPAMHTGTTAFFKNPANKLVADSCGIAVGSSHCEPLLRNNVDEWDEAVRGRFNYMTNRDAVKDYWTERLRQVSESEGGNMFTIGMRGIHDGSMEGVKTPQEKFDALQLVIDDQQKLIGQYIGAPEKQMQVFVPYKEVLELYEMGLNIPDYVTLMWCDDNYGYITRLSTPDEQTRQGGGGVYYHLSYWGRPHDYLWLATTQPGLVYNEMRNAYDHNVRKLWIVNVHDPKAAAYPLSLFLDMAWDINSVKSENVGAHLLQWLESQFGTKAGEQLYPVMRKFYDLTARRRPEFMGWNQVELSKQLYARGLGPVGDTEFSFSEFGGEADRYLEQYLDILAEVERIEPTVAPSLRDAYFAAIKYPVAAAANHAVKMLEAQRARSYANGSTRADMFASQDALYNAAARSQNAYQNIRKLTEWYNDSMSDGRWRRSMNMRPRDLPVGSAPVLPTLLADDEVATRIASAGGAAKRHTLDTDGVVARNACSYDSSTGALRIVDMLGHSGRAVALDPGASLTYNFTLPDSMATPLLTTALIPTQPNDNGRLRYTVSIDGGAPVEFDLKEPFRSEQWKQNVLRAQARRTLQPGPLAPGAHTLTITAIDPHIVVDQWGLDPRPGRRYYLIPVEAEL